MKVISTGRQFSIHNDDLKTYPRIPANAYYLRFSKFKGFYLEQQSELDIKEPKIYGVHPAKVTKVLDSYKRTNKNLGVILSGHKGIGKSLFAKLLSKTAIDEGYPVIIIDQPYPDIPGYLEDITQEVVVLFDEFDKTFSIKSEDNPQESLLSMFDGLSNGKKLFIVTCNKINELSDYLVNRPGRFLYHFRFEYPNLKEIEEYLTDKLNPAYYNEIDKVKKFSTKINLNYDCLCAIAFELNSGLPFEEAIKDLNIMNFKPERYNLTLYFEDGKIMTAKRVAIDMFDQTEPSDAYMNDDKDRDIGYITFNSNEFEYDINTGANILTGDKIKYEANSYYDDHADYKKFTNLKPKKLIAHKERDKNLHYMV